MQINSLVNFPGSYLKAALDSAMTNLGTSNSSTSSTSSVSPTSTKDTNTLSPLAQMLSTLQQLQQSDPSKYQQVTDQISTNLQTAASKAQADGNSTLATQLTQLSNDFKSASTNGQLPSVQDLAKAVGGGGHHHHHHAASQTQSTDQTSQDASSLFSALQVGSQQTDSSTDPFSIIMNTLNQAGLSSSQQS